MKHYTSPKLTFQPLEIFERIADTCWGLGHAWWTGPNSAGQTVTVEADWGRGCGGGLPEEFITALTVAGVDTSQFHNSVANTKAPGFSPTEPMS